MFGQKRKKKGVSPVIAVILMVAITVVLAGVVVLWVTRLAKTNQTAPETMNLEVKLYNQGATYVMTIDNNGGAGTINWANYKITIDGTGISGTDSNGATWTKGVITGGTSSTTGVGERLGFTSLSSHSSGFVTGTGYDVKVINLVTQNVVWEQNVIARSA